MDNNQKEGENRGNPSRVIIFEQVVNMVDEIANRRDEIDNRNDTVTPNHVINPEDRMIVVLGDRVGQPENRTEEDGNRMEDDQHNNSDNEEQRQTSSEDEDEDESWIGAGRYFGVGSSSNYERISNDRSPSPPKVLSYPKPKHNWFVIKELLKRENGGFRNPVAFTKRFYGSLHAVQRLELMYKLEKHSGCVNALNFNMNGSRLISGSDDRLVAVWNWAEGKCLTTFNTGHSSNVFQCKYLPLTGDGHIVTCSRDGQVRLALQNSIGTYDSTEKLAHHNRACHKIALIKQEPHIVMSAGADAQVLSIDVRDKKAQRLMLVKEETKRVNLYSIHVNPLTGNEFCVSGEDYYVRIYDRRYISRSGQSNLKFYPHNLEKPQNIYVTCAVFNYNGTEVMGSYNDDDIYLFDCKHATGSNYIHKYEGHRNSETVKGVNFFGPRSEYVVSGSDCGNIYFWDKNSEAIVQWMRGDEEGVINCLEPHPKIPVLATSGLDLDIKIWVPSCEHEPKMEGIARTVKLNKRKRISRAIGSHDSLNDTLIRWWSHMRLMQRNYSRHGTPIILQIGVNSSDLQSNNSSDPTFSLYSGSSSSAASSDSSSCSDESDNVLD